MPFRLQWSAASRESPFGEGRLSIANVDSRIEEACDLAETPPLLTLELVRVSAPDEVERAIEEAQVPAIDGDETAGLGARGPSRLAHAPPC